MLGMCEKQQGDLCGWSAVSEGGVAGTGAREVMAKDPVHHYKDGGLL